MKRFVFFEFIYFVLTYVLCACMFPACCFRQVSKTLLGILAVLNNVMVKAMDCEIVARAFKLQSRYYVHFWANTIGKGMNPPLSYQLWVK